MAYSSCHRFDSKIKFKTQNTKNGSTELVVVGFTLITISSLQAQRHVAKGAIGALWPAGPCPGA